MVASGTNFLGTIAFIGRKAETGMLESALDRADRGSGTTIFISGPAGIGKTSLMKWLEDTAVRRGVRIRSGYCLPDYFFPFFPFGQVFRQGPTIQLEKSRTNRRTKSAERRLTGQEDASKHAHPAKSTVLQIPARYDVPPQSHGGPPRETEELLRYLTILERETVGSPTLLLVDDFQWADPESIRALKILSRNIRRMRVLLVVALREDEVDDPGLVEVLRDLRREGLTQDIPLSGLPESDVQRLLESFTRATFVSGSDQAVVSVLHQRTGGNPYFVLEIARDLKEGGYLNARGDRFTLNFPRPGKGPFVPPALVPKSVTDLLVRKVKALSEEEREVLEYAALLGSEFDASPLERLLPKPREEGVDQVLARLCTRRGALVKSKVLPNYYTFSHGLLWEAVRGSMAPVRRRAIALRIGTWWEGHFPADVTRILALYLESENGEKVRLAVDKAVAAEFQLHAHERIAECATATLTFLQKAGYADSVILDWGLSIVTRLRKDGAGDQWIAPLCERLMELDVTGPRLWEVMTHRVLSSMLRGGEARKMFSKLRTLVHSGTSGNDATLEGKLRVIETILSYKEGKSRVSQDKALQALALLPESERYYRGLAYQYLGWCAAERSLWEEAHRYLEQAQLVLKVEPMLGLLMYVLNLKAAIMAAGGDLSGAETTQLDIVNIMKGVGHPGRLSISLLNLGMVRFMREDLEGSEASAREALRIAEAFGLPTPEGLAHIQLGLIHEERGESSRALKLYEEALAGLAAGGDSSNVVDVHLNMAEAEISLHELGGARKHLATVERLGSVRADVKIHLHLVQAKLALEVGNRKRSRAELDAALTDSRNQRLRYYEGRSLQLQYRWAQRFGSPREAARLKREAERVLSSCGVASDHKGGPSKTRAQPEPRPLVTPRVSLSMGILSYLLDHGGVVAAFALKDVAPLALTQKGISTGLGLPQNRFSTVLRRLVHKGLVTARSQYVRGMPRKLKVYLLTQEGLGVLER